jgi:hypothetical protein
MPRYNLTLDADGQKDVHGVAEAVEAAGITIVRVLDKIGVITITTDDGVEEVLKIHGVKMVTPDEKRTIC